MMQANQYPCGSTTAAAAMGWPYIHAFHLEICLAGAGGFSDRQKFQWRFKYIGHFKIIQLEVERW